MGTYLQRWQQLGILTYSDGNSWGYLLAAMATVGGYLLTAMATVGGYLLTAMATVGGYLQ